MRIDSYLYIKNYFNSRTKAVQSINRGEVYLNGNKVNKTSLDVDENSNLTIEIVRENNFVSIGGYKLFKALKNFNFNVENLIAYDIGSSTGGFTDCLLQNGAKKVYAVDLNDDQLHNSLKKDNRVVRVIKNAKYLTICDFLDNADLITADLSFISATQVIPTFSKLLSKDKHLILLVKPQFESDIKIKFKNGIIHDKKIQQLALNKVVDCAVCNNFILKNVVETDVSTNKNLEFLILLQKI